MTRNTILSVLGARPQFIKAAVVSRALRDTTGLREILVHTGQHYDANMSDQFFAELDIAQPDHNLGVGSGPHGQQTGRMLTLLEQVLLKEQPNLVLVYGDTNSTAAGAIAAAKLQIPVAHVEAGLRSFNRNMPEEINRLIADHLADILFTPTRVAEDNLRREGFHQDRVVPVGDVMYDTARLFAQKASNNSRILNSLGMEPGHYVLATIHRAENTNEPTRLQAILAGLAQVARQLPVLFPVHPRTRSAMERLGSGSHTGLRFIEPVGYLDMTQLEQNAAVIATDSGGVQKEAYFHGVPCVTLRTETEWTELLHAGANQLCPSSLPDDIAQTILGARGRTWPDHNLYGAGDAAQRIAGHLAARLS